MITELDRFGAVVLAELVAATDVEQRRRLARILDALIGCLVGRRGIPCLLAISSRHWLTYLSDQQAWSDALLGLQVAWRNVEGITGHPI